MNAKTTPARKSPPVSIQVFPNVTLIQAGENQFKVVAENSNDYPRTVRALIENHRVFVNGTRRKVRVSYHRTDGQTVKTLKEVF